MAKFYKQDRGLIVIPPGFDKFHIAWSLDNTLCGFREFYRIHGHWPTYEEIAKTDYLPTVRSLQRSFGGLKNIRQQLGIELLDHRTGETRSLQLKDILKRAWDDEGEMYDLLSKRFGEVYVHFQHAQRLTNYRINVDFLVFHKQGRFAVDVFYPKADKTHYINNIGAKFRTYKDFPYLLYLVITNPDITTNQIAEYLKTTKTEARFDMKLVTKRNFLIELDKYQPLEDPYHQ